MAAIDYRRNSASRLRIDDGSDDDELESAGYNPMMESSSDDETPSDEDVQTVMVFFRKMYEDPQQDVMEMLDGLAGEVLRTGKISVAGTAGDMNLLQPLLFSLQSSSDKELPIILPELLATPFFKQRESSHPFGFTSDYMLANGYFRLQIPIDYIIEELLQSHSCKGPGAAQAEVLIDGALSVNRYTSAQGTMHNVRMLYENAPPFVGYNTETRERSSSNLMEELEDQLQELPNKKSSKASLNSDSGCGSSQRSSSVDFEGMDPPAPPRHPHVSRLASLPAAAPHGRRISVVDPPPISARSPSPAEFGKFMPDMTKWRCSVQDNMVIGMYGRDNSYSLLTWDPKLKTKILLSSFAQPSSSTPSSPVVIESKHPILTFYIKNTTENSLAFSIRANRQSKMFMSHIIYPKEGLHILAPGEEWTKGMDVVPKDTERDEYFVIDILLCAMEVDNSSWNISRQYAVMKSSNGLDQPRALRRISKGLPTFPGSFSTQPRDLSSALKQIFLHGLQAVVKNKLDEAEILFTHALQLPVFQRVPLKAFAYICLAVLANKRRKEEKLLSVRLIVSLVNHAVKLVRSCEFSQTMQMPKLVGLVTQLEKELDIKKIIKDVKPGEAVSITSEQQGVVTAMIGPMGGAIDLEDEHLMIPGGALTSDTSIRFKRNDPDKLRQSVNCTQWSDMLNVITVLEIQCRPPVSQFNKPVIINVPLPKELQKIPSLQLRLLQSNYMSNWQDITDEANSSVQVVGASRDQVQIRTDYTGWLIVARIDFDVTKVMQMAIKSVFHAEPMIVNVNVYGCIFPDNHAQIVAYLKSAKDSRKQRTESPSGFVPIAISDHTIKAHVRQRLRVEVQGLEMDTGSEPSTEFTVEDPLNQIVEKTVKISSPTRLKGRLVISSYCNAPKGWKKLEEIDLRYNSPRSNGHT